MEIKFDFTEKDYLEYSKFYMLNSNTVKRTLFAQRYIVSLVISLISILLFRFFSPYTFLMDVCIFGGAYVLWVLLYPKYFYHTINKRVKRTLKEEKNSNLFGERTIVLTTKGITQISHLGESSNTWKSIEYVTENKNYIYLFINAINAYVIPKATFSSENEKSAFMDLIKKHCTIK